MLENCEAVIVTDIDPDKSSKKVGFESVMEGFSPKLAPRLRELPAS